jgi:hypothetical protein
MSIPYTRDLPEDAAQDLVDATIAHVRAHLSGVASADDDPDTNADDVRVHTEHRDGRIFVIGELDAEPDAPYLRPDFDPEQDVQANPLTVRSIIDQGGDES